MRKLEKPVKSPNEIQKKLQAKAAESKFKEEHAEEAEVLRKMYDAIVREQEIGGGSEPFLVDGAMLLCYQGSEPQPLIVTSHNDEESGKKRSNESDYKPGINITPYGKCKVTTKPCSPSIAGPWVAAKATIDIEGGKSPTKNSFLVCTIGGLIMPLTSGLGMAMPGTGITDELRQEVMEMNLSASFKDSMKSFAETYIGVQGNYQDFLDAFSYGESGGSYKPMPPNPWGFMGKYQIGYDVLKELGIVDNIKRGTVGKYKNVQLGADWLDNEWGLTSREDFENNKNNCQEDIKRKSDKSDKNILGYIKRLGLLSYVGKNFGGVVITQSGLLAGANSLGPSGLANAIKNNDTLAQDGAGKLVTDYLRDFGTYDISELWKVE